MSLSNKRGYCLEKFNIIEENLKSRNFKELKIPIQRKAYEKILLLNATEVVYLECSEKFGYPRLIFLVGNSNKTKEVIEFIENLR